MPWVRFDDMFTTHRKVDGLSDTAFRLHVAAIFWCARHLMDGFVPKDDLDLVSARVRAPARFAAECVSRGLWHLARDRCESPDCPAGDQRSPEANPKQVASQREAGWFIHDYFAYQPSRKRVLLQREIKAANGRVGGLASGKSRRSDRARSKPEPKPKQSASRSVHPRTRDLPPNPPQAGGCDRHRARPKPGCAECAKGPPAARHPSARTVAQAVADATRQEAP